MTSEPKRRIRLVDSNEPEIIRSKLLELGWEQKRLGSGDYFMHTGDFKTVGIERKTVSDLLQSLGKRLSKQLAALVETHDFAILLVEGSWKSVNYQMVTPRGIEQWLWSTVWNYLRSWQDRGITLELTSNEGHTIRRLGELYAYYQKVVHTAGERRRAGDDRLLAFPRTVGPKTAEQILEQFGSLTAVGTASYDQLRGIKGIGPKRAEAILLYYHRDGRAPEVSSFPQGAPRESGDGDMPESPSPQ